MALGLEVTTELLEAMIGICLVFVIYAVMLIKWHREGYSIPKLVKKGELIER
ncbi:hypothetical protein [Haloarcula rubripromontorii]|uniref:hypothetical protein n=1 Tax=Haloarcula rubripromontorii TaxID=1705562 RepID=UPI000ADE4C11|nr:hypothetical protein [Haloarcula rubripromontorii]